MRGCNRGREGGREEEIKAQMIEDKEVSVNKLISLEQQNLLFARRLDSGGASVERGEAKKKKSESESESEKAPGSTQEGIHTRGSSKVLGQPVV